jgi:pseudaminic acid synthase
MIIAEMSGNHNHSLSRAIKIIQQAKKSGADAIKLQTYTPDTITLNSYKKDFLMDHLEKNSLWSKFKNFYQIYDKAHTPWRWHKKLFDEAKKNKIIIFSSPFDETAVDFLEKLNCPAYKIASPEITHIPLIEKVAKTKKPILISTGLSQEKDIDLALKTVRKFHNKIILMKCCTSYPAISKDANLNNLIYFQKKFKVLTGYSDHTNHESITPIIAVSLGARVIEKHFNLGDGKKTIDHFFSLNPTQFKKLVKNIRIAEQAMGLKEYKLSSSALKNFKGRRSIYVSENIMKNEIFTNKNLKVVRPGYGSHPKKLKLYLGKKSKKSYKKGDRFI